MQQTEHHLQTIYPMADTAENAINSDQNSAISVVVESKSNKSLQQQQQQESTSKNDSNEKVSDATVVTFPKIIVTPKNIIANNNNEQPDVSPPINIKAKVKYKRTPYPGNIPDLPWYYNFTTDTFSLWAFILQIAILVQIALFGVYGKDYNHYAVGPSDITVTEVYTMTIFQNVGLFTFLALATHFSYIKKYSYTTLGVSLVCLAFVMQLYPLVNTYWSQAILPLPDTKADGITVVLDLSALLRAQFCTASVLISFGSVFGKLGPTQYLLVAVIETILYGLTFILGQLLKVYDAAGSMYLHVFGAFFGLGCTIVISGHRTVSRSRYHDNASSYTSDIFALIGSVLLFTFFPTFNSTFTTNKQLAALNTFLALCGSCTITFMTSKVLRKSKKFNMVDIQNATLSGGVSIAAVGDFPLGPAASIGIGMISGLLSTLLYNKLQSWVEKRSRLHDSCGVLNSHGVGGVVGGIISSILPVIFEKRVADGSLSANVLRDIYPAVLADERSYTSQAQMQVVYLLICIGIGCVGGVIVGFVIKRVDPVESFFVDREHWETPDDLDYRTKRKGSPLKFKAASWVV